MQKIYIGLFLLAFFGTQALHAEVKVGIIFDKGGKDDKSFNASAYRGLMEAKEKLKVSVKYVEATDDNSFEPHLRSFVRKGYDLIISVGFSQADALKKIATENPKSHFALIDSTVDLPNVRSLMFAEHEGSFVVGALAALKSQTGKVGFIGGMDTPLIRRFEMGYKAGAAHVKPKTQVVSNFVGSTADAWNNPPKAKELATSQYGSGVDVIFAAAGASGTGVLMPQKRRKNSSSASIPIKTG